MKSAKADLALVGVTAIWGCTFLLVKGALDNVSPILFLALRFGLAAVVLALVYRKRLLADGIVPGLAAGLFLFGGYAFQTVGLQYTTASKSAFLTSMLTPMVPLAASLVYRKGPRPLELAGILVASMGMVLMTVPTSFAAIGSGINRGDLLSFLCAVSFAGQVVAVSYLAGRGNFETLAFVQMLTASLLSLGSFWWMETPKLHWEPRVVVALLATGLLASALAFSVQAWAQQYTSVNRAAIIYTLEPVFAWLTSWWLAGERLSQKAGFGAVLILFGILIVELKQTGLKRGPIREHLNG
jgi:drug/metabolite transporter (DMT)-like permease